jgi:flagellar biosynthesis/type III secretory pathway protein FliH
MDEASGLVEMRERAEREARDWSQGMTGVAGEFYQQGFDHGFQIGYMAAVRNARETQTKAPVSDDSP